MDASATLATFLGTNAPEEVVVVTDIGADLDDEWSFMVYAALQRAGLIKLKCVVANLRPSNDRARLLSGMMAELGYGYDLPAVPVGMGTGIIANRNNERCPTDENCSYMAPHESLRSGDEALIDVLIDAEPKSLTVVLQSGFTDFAALCLFHGKLVAEKVAKVVIMGGVEVSPARSSWRSWLPFGNRRNSSNDGVVLEHGLMQPNNANNNTFNFDAAELVYEWCQKRCIPMVVTMRDLAYAAPFHFAMYEQAAELASPIGACMRDRQGASLQTLWQRAHAPVASEERGPLPADRDRAWFVKVFCEGNDPGITAEEQILPHAAKFNLYDPINAMAAVDALREHFFAPTKVKVNGITHEIIGISKQNPGISPDRAEELVELMTEMILSALTAGHLASATRA